MSLFMGYTKDDFNITMEGELNMDSQPLRNLPPPSQDHDAISSSWFRKHVRSQSIVYKYHGLTALNVMRVPDYNHGNYKGSDALYSKQYTKDSEIFLRDISLDKDTTDYDIKLKFYVRLLFDYGVASDHDISSGGIELKTRDNHTVNFWNDLVRWVDIDIGVPLRSLTLTPERVRFVIIVAEQVRGAVGGNEFTVHCEVNEY